MRQGLMAIIGGVITLVVGLVLADTVIDSTTTALTNASIGSFTGASGIGGLVPMIYFVVIISVAVGLVGLGGASLVGRGGLRVNMAPVAMVGIAVATAPVSSFIVPVVAASVAAGYAGHMLGTRLSQRVE